MYQKVREKQGITLIALVITIIILLILAGISISSLTQSGLFSASQNAVDETEKAQIKENILLDIYAEQVANGGDISDSKLLEILEKY